MISVNLDELHLTIEQFNFLMSLTSIFLGSTLLIFIFFVFLKN